MINRVELDAFESIKEVTDLGQWYVNEKYGWMPQTQYSSAVFNADGVFVDLCWQKSGLTCTQEPILYFRINLRGRELRKPLSFMLEADDFFRMCYLLDDIQSNGIEMVDTQARKKHYSRYIRKDANHLLYEAAFSPDKTDRYLEQMKIWSQLDEQFADQCADSYTSQAIPVRLFSAYGCERMENSTTKDHNFTISHTPVNRKGMQKVRPFCIQIQESREVGKAKMKSVHLDLTAEQFSAFVTAMWEAYKQWWHGK